MKLISADHVIPISSSPIQNGAVVFEDDKIIAVGDSTDLIAQFPNAEKLTYQNAALMPGFVNCHSHLELTAMRGYLDDVEQDFGAWLLKLTKRRYEMSDAELYQSVFSGIQEAVAGGVTCVGDIGRNAEQSLQAIKDVGLRAVVYQETKFSPDDKTADVDLKDLINIFENLAAQSTDLIEVGISPHSPYTVGAKLLNQIADYSILNKVKLTVHCAESAAEKELLENGTGFFAEMHKKFDIQWRSPNCSPTKYLDKLGVLKAKPLLAHCIRVSEQDIDLIADSGSAVAHCSCSNGKFGHGVAPLAKFLNAGIDVGLGTDSVASNNICDMITEARFASYLSRNLGEYLSAAKMLELATLGGANALGLEKKIGTLENGKQADLAIIALDQPGNGDIFDIYSKVVFASNSRDIVATYVAGKTVYTK